MPQTSNQFKRAVLFFYHTFFFGFLTFSLFLVSLISGVGVATRLCRPVDDHPPLSSIMGHHPPVHVLQLRLSHVSLDAIAPSHAWSSSLSLSPLIVFLILKVPVFPTFPLSCDSLVSSTLRVTAMLCLQVPARRMQRLLSSLVRLILSVLTTWMTQPWWYVSPGQDAVTKTSGFVIIMLFIFLCHLEFSNPVIWIPTCCPVFKTHCITGLRSALFIVALLIIIM